MAHTLHTYILLYFSSMNIIRFFPLSLQPYKYVNNFMRTNSLFPHYVLIFKLYFHFSEKIILFFYHVLIAQFLSTYWVNETIFLYYVLIIIIYLFKWEDEPFLWYSPCVINFKILCEQSQSFPITFSLKRTKRGYVHMA